MGQYSSKLRERGVESEDNNHDALFLESSWNLNKSSSLPKLDCHMKERKHGEILPENVTFNTETQGLRSATSVPCISGKRNLRVKTHWPLHTNETLFLPEFAIKPREMQQFKV